VTRPSESRPTPRPQSKQQPDNRTAACGRQDASEPTKDAFLVLLALPGLSVADVGPEGNHVVEGAPPPDDAAGVGRG